MVNFKKVVAGVALAGMVLAGGTAAFAGAGVTASDGKVVQFAAQYDDGTWAAAPHDMNDANIASATANADGTYTLALKEGTYNIDMGIMTMPMTGKIVTVSDANGVISVDSNADGYADSVTMATGESNKYTMVMEAGSGSLGHDATREVYLMAN